MTRPVVTPEHINVTQDALVLMRFLGQRLSVGEVTDDEAGEMSWLLGGAKKRLDAVLEILEQIEFHQDHHQHSATPTDDLLELGSDILALTEKLNRRRRALQEPKA